MMELSPSSSFCPGTFPPTTNFFLFNRTIPPVHINNLNNQTKPPVHINNLRVNQGCPVPAKRVGLLKKIQIQNKQPHLGAKQGIAPADYTISNQNTQPGSGRLKIVTGKPEAAGEAVRPRVDGVAWQLTLDYTAPL